MEQEQVRLYMRDVAYGAFREAVANAGQVLAWYREYREPAPLERGYRELDWVLTEHALLRIEIVPTAIDISTFMRAHFSRITRYYRIVQGAEGYQRVLNRVVIKCANGETCEMMRPLDEVMDKVKVEDFARLAELLG
ncbi:MAG: hypothetical protein QHH05_01510 [Syntrophomonadaceae bacterium]|jgi:hypothetical protein|nr:hypothetical protein [Syntrophomonadaceae bacterium]MDH7497113.1 hypothetical protein [Syntrophomonadaceae bacterium]